MSDPDPIPRGEILWQPDIASIERSNMRRYQEFLRTGRGLTFSGYPRLLEWSTDQPELFWKTIAEFFEVRFRSPAQSVLSSMEMPGWHWFPGATLNYAEHALRSGPDTDAPAIIATGEPDAAGEHHTRRISRAELHRQVAAVAEELRRAGVHQGDTVGAYLPNVPETVVAFLAAASLGAVWSTCPCELAAKGVIDRFGQIAPKVLFTVTRYRYGGKIHDRRAVVEEIAAGLPSVTRVVRIDPVRDEHAATDPAPGLPAHASFESWEAIIARTDVPPLSFNPVPFEHPLWVLYSSGTTGIPKPIVHGHGGILLEHLKSLSLHCDLRAGDRFFWYTTAGWMMWNFIVSGLLLPGVTVVLYDGSPRYPDFNCLWEMADRLGVTYFGTSAPYLGACMKEGISPAAKFPLTALRGLGSTGAPLPREGFRWVYEHVKKDLLLGSVSGGTDVCTAFILSNPLLPVRAGELQCRGLGAAIEAWDDNGKPVLDTMGELVVTKPYPSMPIYFWGDADGARFRASYFERFPGVWCHGDWIEISSADGQCIIHGRSDSTLNRGGVRIGTAEFYRVVEEVPEVAEALVIDLSGLDRPDRLVLFVALKEGVELTDALKGAINTRLKKDASPRHVPDAIYAVPAIPHTLNGKKLEVPVKRILTGMPLEKAVSREAVGNPDALDPFIALAGKA